MLVNAFLQAETAYNIYPMSLSSDYSEARSINGNGTVAGQTLINGVCADFTWSLAKGWQILATGTVKGCFPQINEDGQVAGLLGEQDAVRSSKIYVYDPLKDMQITEIPETWPSSNIFIRHIADQGVVFISDHTDIEKISCYGFWTNGRLALVYPCVAIKEKYFGQYIPIAFNTRGESVGICKDVEGAYLQKSNGELVDLKDAIKYSTPFIEGFETLIGAWAINDQGCIAGAAMIAGKTQAIFLVPQECKGN